jgi:hypothetical protein
MAPGGRTPLAREEAALVVALDVAGDEVSEGVLPRR